jgi:hypothetical protein
VITAPGLVYRMSAAEYHGDPCPTPSLSSSLARVLIQDSPRHAWIDHPRLNTAREVREASPAMRRGSLVHAILAGGEGIVVGEFEDYKTKAAREWRDAATAEGKTPVLEKDIHEANAIADSVRANAAGGADNDPFKSALAAHEVAGFWQENGAWFRLLADCLVADPTGTCDLWDWKVTSDVTDRALERKIADMGYVFQLAFYLRGLANLMPQYAGRFSACLVFVEDHAPYTVRRVYFSPEYMRHAEREVSRACELWAHCMTTGSFADPRNGSALTLELPSYLVADDEISID